MAVAGQLKRVFFEKEALDYPMGRRIYQRIQDDGYEIQFLRSHNRVTGIPGNTPREAFFQGKSTLVVGVRKTLDFAPCKPSAHYQLPLVTGCEGICEYCYLNTQLGKKPYTRIYVNVEEILNQAAVLISQRQPEITVFEAAATSDPVSVEPYSGSLTRAIAFFAEQEYGRLRFVTKFAYVDSFLKLNHRGHTRIRYSINSDRVIRSYEHRTPSLQQRLQALSRVIAAGYPSGVIIAPVILTPGWQQDYSDLLHQLADHLDYSPKMDFAFEVISHRFTTRARSNILDVFPHTDLPMDETTDRKYKYGQFGYGKYVYTGELLEEMKAFFREEINRLFPQAAINYLI
ncbi:MAG TPA: spore photoproduct lyase [Syntrophomonadaceae bacterium]|nr:spore photoproduct lyase [Syntrophomonadaceae bacterium]HQE23670.1 spore photoproduct lyase [Syntrophomonadaceae bacterium]